MIRASFCHLIRSNGRDYSTFGAVTYIYAHTEHEIKIVDITSLLTQKKKDKLLRTKVNNSTFYSIQSLPNFEKTQNNCQWDTSKLKNVRRNCCLQEDEWLPITTSKKNFYLPKVYAHPLTQFPNSVSNWYSTKCVQYSTKTIGETVLPHFSNTATVQDLFQTFSYTCFNYSSLNKSRLP